ncbi:Sex-lethal-like protein [Diplonema papillatum]|nr:Sex-lethal-like protein [Diplonema papillatum]
MPQVDNVYVKNLPHNVLEPTVMEIFSAYGEVVSLKVLTKENYSSSTALVKFADPNAAQMAIEALNGGIPEALQAVMNVGLECRLANSPEEKATHMQQAAMGKGAKGGVMYPPPMGGMMKGGKGMSQYAPPAYSPYPAGRGAMAGEVHNYKTVLCRNWMTSGSCPRMDSCTFAHGDGDMRGGYNGGGGKKGGPPAAYSAPVYATKPVAAPAAPNGHAPGGRWSGSEQIEYLRNINHPLLGSLRNSADQGEDGAMVQISSLPSWMDEAGLYFLFAPYGAINSCQINRLSPGTALLRYVHQRAAVNAVTQLNGLRIDPGTKGLIVESHTESGAVSAYPEYSEYNPASEPAA